MKVERACLVNYDVYTFGSTFSPYRVYKVFKTNIINAGI